MSHLLSAVQIFLNKCHEFFLLLYQLFLNQGLQHPCACCKGDDELTTAHFNIQLPGLGVLP